MIKIKKRARFPKKHYQCCICGNSEERSQICCGHPMVELKTNWDLLNWDILEWKKKIPHGKR